MKNEDIRKKLLVAVVLIGLTALPALAGTMVLVYAGHEYSGWNCGLNLYIQRNGPAHEVSGVMYDGHGRQYAVSGVYSPSNNSLDGRITYADNGVRRTARITGYVSNDTLVANVPYHLGGNQWETLRFTCPLSRRYVVYGGNTLR